MTSDPSHHVRQLLARREAELTALLRATDGVPDTGVDAAAAEVTDFKDVAGALAAARADAAQADRAAAQLHEIAAARARIDEGTYGLCTQCGNRIAQERLELLPEASRCVACESARERVQAA